MTIDSAPVAHHDTQVLDYLGALWAETADLAPELRDELMSTVADFIARRRVAAGDDPEVVLHRLGPPEAIAAAVRRGRMPPHLRLPARPVPAPPPGAGPLDYAGIALLTGGALALPVIAPLAGILLVTGSPKWSPLEKTAAWLVAGLPVLFGLLLVVVSLLTTNGGPWFALALIALVSGPVLAGLALLPGLARRRPAP
jgi:hypothetical protein